jgi:acetyl esterase
MNSLNASISTSPLRHPGAASPSLRQSVRHLASSICGLTLDLSLAVSASAPTRPLRRTRARWSADDHATVEILRPDDDQLYPALVYYHGGAFRSLSTRSHRALVARYAAMGYVVFNIDYRLAPEHPFPAAHNDAARSWAWVMRNAHHHGAHLQQRVIAGESAGANLAVSVVTAQQAGSTPDWAHALSTVPVATDLIAACGLLQVSNPGRFRDSSVAGPAVVASLQSILDDLVQGVRPSDTPAGYDPLLRVERLRAPSSWPRTLVFCGTMDPLMADSRRLHTALTRIGADSSLHVYDGGLHSFHAFPFSDISRRCWQDQRAWLASDAAATPNMAVPNQLPPSLSVAA